MFLSLNFETPGIEVLVVTYEKMKMPEVLHTANLEINHCNLQIPKIMYSLLKIPEL